MDLASERARRKNRSSTNLNHLTLAPLTVKLPLDDALEREISNPTPTTPSTSYLQGKSAPTTPRLITRSPGGHRSRSHHRTDSAPNASVTKSKSTTHLAPKSSRRSGTKSGTATPNGRRKRGDDGLGAKDRTDSDWLLRTGALMSTEAREYKGQAWLVSRQSSTSLAGMRDAEDEAFEEELALEREASRRQSRRGSSVLADDDVASPYASRYASRVHSRAHSRAHSRSHSIAPGMQSHLLSPMERLDSGSYFDEQAISGPDFVNLDEKLEELETAAQDDDEATVRRLVRRGQAGKDSWLSSIVGFSLFPLEENEESSDDDTVDEDTVSQGGRSNWSNRHAEDHPSTSSNIAPPEKDEGPWKDAAWLLTVATKVMF